jgi:hypothetical protein
MLVGFGLAALLIARNYKMGTAFRMGPGYFPVVLAILLIVIGIIVAGLALRSDEVTLPKLAWRPLLIVTGATVLFGLFINGAGMVLTTLGLVIASRLARSGYPWLETAILAAGLSAICAGVFYFGLRIQMPLLPTWWG